MRCRPSCGLQCLAGGSAVLLGLVQRGNRITASGNGDQPASLGQLSRTACCGVGRGIEGLDLESIPVQHFDGRSLATVVQPDAAEPSAST